MTDAPDQHTQLNDFERERPLLFALAYRMLGSVMDAEDIVQEAFLRWQQAPVQHIASPQAYLQRIVTRLCIDQLRSARVQREAYIGPWLLGPLIQSEDAELRAAADLADSLSLGFLRLLERLTPIERAIFLVHDVFGYTYEEIARVVGKSAVHCRQLGHPARESIVAERPRFTATPAQVEQLTRQFIRACTEGTCRGCWRSSPPTSRSGPTAAASPVRCAIRSSARIAWRDSCLVCAGRCQFPASSGQYI